MASIVLAKKKVFSRPRSISGCLTCKYRRVKCDETKPKCRRCIKFGTDCDGYETRATKVNQKATRGLPRVIPILPYSTDRSQLWYLQPSQDFSFQSDLEAFYFLNFRDCVAPELAGPLGSSLWSRIILQSCHFECYVRETVVALAALRMSLSTVHKSTMPQSSIEISAQHYRFALQQYGKAVRNMRKALAVSNTENSIRKALLCCLLVFCFEAFQGNHDLAILHAKSGFQLLQEWFVTKPYGSSSAGGISYVGHTSIENDIVRAFNRLDLQIMTYTNSDPLEVHKFASQDGGSMVAHMPSLFSNLDEANRYWELVMKRNHHFIHSVIATAEVSTSRHSSTRAATKTNFRAGIGSHIRSFSHSNRFPILQAEHSLYSAEITRWQSAFKPFLSSTNGCMHAGAAMLQMHSISTQITLDLLIANEDAVNEYTDKFQEILYLVKSGVLGLGQETFSMDLGIIPSLYVVVGNCRDPVLQSEALHILASTVRREGLWSSLDIQIKDKNLS